MGFSPGFSRDARPRHRKIVRQKMGDAECDASGRAAFSNSRQNLWGMTLSGETTRKAPAQTELRPTCAELPRQPARAYGLKLRVETG
jgi:hypothetical protein